MIPKRVLTIAGSDSGGGAGIQADLKTITVLGAFGMSVLTALTAQNTLGVHGIYDVSPEFVAAQFDAVATDVGIDAAKTGMLATTDVIRTVAGKIRQYGIRKMVVDPVMVAKGGAPLIRKEAMATLVAELLPLALVLTPNIPEAEVLSGVKIVNLDGMKEAAQIIRKMGPKHVVVKGGHLDGEATDLLCDESGFRIFSSRRFPTQDTHGTGCTFSAAITTFLAFGMDVPGAVTMAKSYIEEAIRHSWRIGEGHGPTNHLAPLFAAGDAKLPEDWEGQWNEVGS
jgi:hydroxymethylpyrimidine/phosphomethylpyrimidine kinase